jgi:hypothetical protein
MRSFVIAGIGRGAVRTCRRAFSSDGATGLVVRVAEPSLAMVPQGLSRALNRESNGENRVYSVQPSTTWTTLLHCRSVVGAKFCDC